MPDPQADPHLAAVKRIALHALIAGIVIALLKFGVFWMTNSVAVLSDALESLINIAAAGFMLYSLWYSNRPADREHPYGHGKIEFLAIGLEGWLILLAGLVIGVEAVRRLIVGAELNLNAGIWVLGVVGLLDFGLAAYVWRAGRKYQNDVLRADGKHLATDVASTAGVIGGLVLVRWTGYQWLDPVVAIVMASLILFVSWHMLWQSFHGLMDHSDPKDEAAIKALLDDEVRAGAIHGYHKVRHRHTGPFHWVDMHLQVDGEMTISDGHELASRIEGRVEETLGRANATAHLEPYDPQRHPPAGLSAGDVAAEGADATVAAEAQQAGSDVEPGAESEASEASDENEAPAKGKPDKPKPPPSAPLDRPELADERDPSDESDDSNDQSANRTKRPNPPADG